MMYKIFRTELYKTLTGYGFYLCAFFTVILCFNTGIYHDSINNNYSVIRSITLFDRNYMLSNTDFSSINVALKGAGSWFTMFIPIISAFPFIPLVCDESESNSIRNVIFRLTRFSYSLSKFIVACLSGGLAVTLGYLVYIGFSFAVFPDINTYSLELREIYLESLSYAYPNIYKYGTSSTLIIKCTEIFIYGAFNAIPSILLTAISKNKYIIMCIPFFLKYFLTQTSAKLLAQAYSNFDNIDEKLIKFSDIINPDSILNIYETVEKEIIISYNITLVICALIFYVIIQLRRFDCGK